jgi:hypothetical protein
MDPASAAERLGHSDGGALFLRTHRHLYEGEKRRQAAQLGARVQALSDEEWAERDRERAASLNQAEEDDGRNQTLRKPCRHRAADPSRRLGRRRKGASASLRD